jgi:hypothetical protein
MIFTVGVPFTMLSSVEHGEERCYEFELDLTLYQEVVSMTHPLRLAVPASARIYAS